MQVETGAVTTSNGSTSHCCKQPDRSCWWTWTYCHLEQRTHRSSYGFTTLTECYEYWRHRSGWRETSVTRWGRVRECKYHLPKILRPHPSQQPRVPIHGHGRRVRFKLCNMLRHFQPARHGEIDHMQSFVPLELLRCICWEPRIHRHSHLPTLQIYSPPKAWFGCEQCHQQTIADRWRRGTPT